MPRTTTLLQAAAAGLALARLSRGRARRPPLRAGPAPDARISVVVPARDEAQRLGPCLAALAADPGVHEVLVVDDRSADATAAVARAAGALVIEGEEPPPGWVGKPWALQQGVEAAAGDVVVCLDADTRPAPGLAGALARVLAEGGADYVTAGPRFACDTAGERWLHPSFLASLVYRFGPSDADAPGAPIVANGQCTAVRRAPFLAAGGYAPAAVHMTDDAALARALAAQGWRLQFRDASALLEVDMHASAGELWREWGRSIALADVTPAPRLAVDVAVVWLVLALPVLRTAARRPTPLDLGLLAVRGCAPGRPAWQLHDPRRRVLAVAAGRSGHGGAAHVVGAAPAAGVAGPGLRRTRNSTPMSVISAPVPATCVTGSVTSWASGNANTPSRAPQVNAYATVTTRHNARHASAATGDSAKAPPTKHMTDLPPRNPVHTGSACPTMAAATAAKPVHQPPSQRPMRPASSALAPSPRNAGSARLPPSCSSAFQAPGLPSPVVNRSTPWARATSSATGIAPSR